MAILVGNRSDTVRTLAGFTFTFEKDQEVYVPDNPHLIEACVERGHVVLQNTTKEPPTTEPTTVQPKKTVAKKTTARRPSAKAA